MRPETTEMTVPAEGARHVLLARLLLGCTLGGVLVGIVIAQIDAHATGASWTDPFSDLLFFLGFLAFPLTGYVLATRRPDNSLGWLLLGIGVAIGLGSITSSYGTYAMHGGPGGAEVGAIVTAIDGPMWLPLLVPTLTYLLLLFPDGHLPSPRWRWFARIIGASYVLIFLLIVVGPGRLTESAFPDLENPLGIEALRPYLDLLLGVFLMVPIGIAGSLLSLVLRFRRSTGVERLQMRWLLTAAGIVGVLYSFILILSFSAEWGGTTTPTWLAVLQTVSVLSFALIPIAIGIAVLRYRLFEIDVVINRAVLFAALALFITAVYIAIVVGVGAIVGSRGDPVLSAVAAAAVALAFQPVRRRAQRLADRMVYGKRATPYEVLSEFSDRVGNAYANEELLPRMAAALAGGTGALRTDVWIAFDEELRPAATWPADAPAIPPVPLEQVEEAAATSLRVPVRHQGELLGALSIEKKPGDAVTPVEEKLVRDLAAQAGLVIRNVALTEQLLDHIEQLRASRQRLVQAQDEERRKIERNLHDGAQQQLVALSVKLRLAEGLVERDTAKAREVLTQLQTEAADAIDTLRDLARGIYPPLLADQGLVAALSSQARKAAIPTEVVGDQIARYPQDVEATVYFCALEALNNVAKYANATRAEVRLAQDDGFVTFAVTDDGAGFDPSRTGYGTGLRGMADRIDAVNGTLEVTSTPGRGTTVSGRIPAGS
jgi:signal transduction histidine kinase